MTCSKIKEDVMSERIKTLTLIYSDISVIHENVYADMRNTPRKITRFDDEKFYLETWRKPYQTLYETNNGGYQLVDIVKSGFITGSTECEAYYDSFTYYDGESLIAEEIIPDVATYRTIYKVN